MTRISVSGRLIIVPTGGCKYDFTRWNRDGGSTNPLVNLPLNRLLPNVENCGGEGVFAIAMRPRCHNELVGE